MIDGGRLYKGNRSLREEGGAPQSTYKERQKDKTREIGPVAGGA